MDSPSTSSITNGKRHSETVFDDAVPSKRAKMEELADAGVFDTGSPLSTLSSGPLSPLKIRFRTSSGNGPLASPAQPSKRAIRPAKHTPVAEGGSSSPPSRKIAQKKPSLTHGHISPYVAIPGKYLELQDGTCLKQRYKPAKKCSVCLQRQAQQACLFQNFRTFIVDESPYNLITADTPTFFASSTEPDFLLQLPTSFNRPVTPADEQDLTVSSAKALLPTMQQELEHARRPNAVRRPFDYRDRNTCDFCLQTFFIGSWFCGECGRDFCFECCEEIKRYLPGQGHALHFTDPRSALDAASAQIREPPTSSTPFESEPNYSETGRVQRKPSTSKSTSPPVPTGGGRFTISPFAAADHSKLPPSVLLKNGKIQDKQLKRLLNCSAARLHSLDFLIPVTSKNEPELALLVKEMTETASSNEASQMERDPYKIPAGLEGKAVARAPEKSLPYLIVAAADLTDETFEKVWSQGQTLVVDGLDKKLEIDWSPKSFSTAFPKMDCEVQDCGTGLIRKTKIADFFSTYGRSDPQGEIWKLKDWPPGDDFAIWNPDLYSDYANALPVPDVTRRDGARNLAARFPINVNKPDLGPKMYSAHKGDDGPYGKGTTRLHMDAADAVNVMVYASDVNGQPGTALWYIYPAADADKIRQFCFEIEAVERSKPGKPVTAEDVAKSMDDPIHEQQIYFNAYLREQLLSRHGVQGWRIEQKVGQAVFIPAGSPHQVVNSADCIKVASDFVSKENIDRCWQTTSEFRKCTKIRAWRSDLLQIKNLMYYTWLACTRQEEVNSNASPSDAADPPHMHEQPVGDSMPPNASPSSSPPIASRPLPRLRGRDPADIVPVLKPGPSTAVGTRPGSTLESPVHPVNTPIPGLPAMAPDEVPEYVHLTEMLDGNSFESIPLTLAPPPAESSKSVDTPAYRMQLYG